MGSVRAMRRALRRVIDALLEEGNLSKSLCGGRTFLRVRVWKERHDRVGPDRTRDDHGTNERPAPPRLDLPEDAGDRPGEPHPPDDPPSHNPYQRAPLVSPT